MAPDATSQQQEHDDLRQTNTAQTAQSSAHDFADPARHNSRRTVDGPQRSGSRRTIASRAGSNASAAGEQHGLGRMLSAAKFHRKRPGSQRDANGSSIASVRGTNANAQRPGLQPTMDTLKSFQKGPQNKAPRVRDTDATPASADEFFSLAGRRPQIDTNQPFVDPNYHALNPQYQQPNRGPVWGLARPLPRVIRRGMIKNQNAGDAVQLEDDRVGETAGGPAADHEDSPGHPVGEAPGGPAATEEQRENYEHKDHRMGEDASGPAERTPHLDEGPGKPPPDAASHRTPSVKTSPPYPAGSEPVAHVDADLRRFGSPVEEVGDPMEDWREEPARPDTARTKSDGQLSAIKEQLSDLPKPQKAGDHLDGIDTPDSEDTVVEDGTLYEEEHLNHLCKWRSALREPLAEWLATTTSLFIGIAADLQVTTSNAKAGDAQQKYWAWGFGVMLGIYIAGGISGAHINPVVSISLSVFRGFPAKRCVSYIIAQILGAVCASALAFAIYKDAINMYDPGRTLRGTGTAFFILPQEFCSSATAFFSDFVASAILAGTILALGDDQNAPPGAGMHALIIGFVVTALAMCLGYNTGANNNPARDIGARLVTWWVGYGRGMWWDGYWAWGGWVAPVFGGLIGCAIYDMCIFVGGESPVNYPRSRRRRVVENEKRRWWDRWRKTKETGQVVGKDVEQGLAQIKRLSR